MKRKIAAIFAADIAGYSRLVAEDEEETLRRLASYREVTDDFIAKYGGRIFNTAGDAGLAEFPSAVEAVRCAIDIQESLRTRNLACPPSRQMAFRIGITIGDVVERDGDLLGDGVNIAARLEGLAGRGRHGLGLKAADETAAVNAALGDCVKRDSDCHVIAIGPFTVGPN
jgi:adenylate cyclase